MFANLQQTASLWFRERTGLTANFLILSCIAVIAALVTFIFSVLAVTRGQRSSSDQSSEASPPPAFF